MSAHPTPPALKLALTELPRASVEAGMAIIGLPRLIRRHRGGDGHPVLVLPGYGAADGSTALLRYFLNAIGYRAYALELGRNLESSEQRIRSIDDATRFRETMTLAAVKRIDELFDQHNEPVSLVGWSMGGLYAHDASDRVPAKVRQLITLGSPYGDLRGTSLFALMRRLSRSEIPVEEQDFDGWSNRATEREHAVPTTVLFSRRDGIVGVDVAKLAAGENVRHIEVDSSHVAFTVNRKSLATIAGLLRS